MNKSKFREKLIAEGYCDERGAGFCATATILPAHGGGVVALFVKGNRLNVYDTDIKSNIGRLLYEIELSGVEGLKIRSNILSQILEFKYKGRTYSFTNFLGVKPALKVIEEESKK